MKQKVSQVYKLPTEDEQYLKLMSLRNQKTNLAKT